MRYALLADLAAQAGWNRLAEVAGKDDLRDADDDLIRGPALRAAAAAPPVAGTPMAEALARIDRALDDASALVDSHVLARYPDYGQPERSADDPPTPVTVWTVDLALERLLSAGEDDEWQRRADEARKSLRMIARGDMDLPGDIDGDGDADDGGVGPLVAKARPALTADSLRAFTAGARGRLGARA